LESLPPFDARSAVDLYSCPLYLRVRGYRFFFFSLEALDPPHIHVAHAGRYAKFWLEPVSVANVRGFRGHEMTEIRDIVRRMRAFSWRNGMRTLVAKAEALAVDVSCSNDALSITLSDGRVVSAPLVWFPRLADATAKERSDWELIGGGIGIHWESIDEDISVASLLHPENFMRLPEKVSRPMVRKRRR
jgi:hypothetical protein